LLGNNTFTYCLNNPIAFIDPHGLCTYVGYAPWLIPNGQYIDCGSKHCSKSSKYVRGTLTVGISSSITVVVGASDSTVLSFDRHKNIEVQKGESRPNKRETTTIGLFSIAPASVVIQITNKGDVSELTGISTYAGFSLGIVGFDVVSDAPAADMDGEIIGVQISLGFGEGVDAHLTQTDTKTTHRFTWKDVGKWINTTCG